jgi:myo-inositol catabolism protein IolC
MQNKITDEELVDSVSMNYIDLIKAWKKNREEIQQ